MKPTNTMTTRYLKAQIRKLAGKNVRLSEITTDFKHSYDDHWTVMILLICEYDDQYRVITFDEEAWGATLEHAVWNSYKIILAQIEHDFHIITSHKPDTMEVFGEEQLSEDVVEGEEILSQEQQIELALVDGRELRELLTKDREK